MVYVQKSCFFTYPMKQKREPHRGPESKTTPVRASSEYLDITSDVQKKTKHQAVPSQETIPCVLFAHKKNLDADSSAWR